MLLLQREFRELTPAHHLRGAVRNEKLSDQAGQFLPAHRSPSAPRLVHALVSFAANGLSVQAPWGGAGLLDAPGRRRAPEPGALIPIYGQF